MLAFYAFEKKIESKAKPPFNRKKIITIANPKTLSDAANVKNTIEKICPNKSSKYTEYITKLIFIANNINSILINVNIKYRFIKIAPINPIKNNKNEKKRNTIKLKFNKKKQP